MASLQWGTGRCARATGVGRDDTGGSEGVVFGDRGGVALSKECPPANERWFWVPLAVALDRQCL